MQNLLLEHGWFSLDNLMKMISFTHVPTSEYTGQSNIFSKLKIKIRDFLKYTYSNVLNYHLLIMILLVSVTNKKKKKIMVIHRMTKSDIMLLNLNFLYASKYLAYCFFPLNIKTEVLEGFCIIDALVSKRTLQSKTSHL